jgi:predicted PurR-regulated permease PerM
MKTTPDKHDISYYNIAAWILVTASLLLAINIHLLPALLAGLTVYELVHILAPFIRIKNISGNRARIVVVSLLSVVIVAALTLFVIGTLTFFRSDSGSLPKLLQKMADIIDGSRAMLPSWIVEHFPTDAESLKTGVAEWLRQHAAELQMIGREAAHIAGHILAGMVIGALISLHESIPTHKYRPLSRALVGSITKLSTAFRHVVFAQVRIAALNAIFTWLYLEIALPLFGVHLPFAKSLVLITFLAGMLPIIGNLISNAIIVIISLSHSLAIAIASLVFLVVVHKLEYFLNEIGRAHV